jgi:hypothetical protein
MESTIKFNFLLNEASLVRTSDLKVIEKIANNPFRSISAGDYEKECISIGNESYEVVGINISPNNGECSINIDLKVK